MSEELLTGEICYDISAKTDIIVDDGDKHFCKTAYGEYSIPGSTVRGLIRNNVQILGLSSIGEDIDSYALMYRSVASGPYKEKEKYARILGVDKNNEETRGIARNVKAGYIILKSGNYYINEVKETFDKETNYLMLSSRYILSHKKDFPFFMQDGKNYMMYTKDCEFVRKETITGKFEGKQVKFIIKTEEKEKVEQCLTDSKFSFKKSKIYFKKGNKIIEIQEIGKEGEYDDEGIVSYNKKEGKIDRRISYEPKEKRMINPYYAPYYREVFFQLDKEHKRVISVYDKGSKIDFVLSDVQKGYVLSSGWMNDKKNLYIIPEEEFNSEDAIKIPLEDIRAFSADLQQRKTTLKQYFKYKNGMEVSEKERMDRAEAFFGLPQKEGERKPVFFIELGKQLYFGFTPRLRMFYDYEICQGIDKNHKKDIMDYSKAIFGYSNKNESYKSKVSFSDAVAKSAKESPDLRKPLLRSPKPTSYLDYLVQSGNQSGEVITYNDFQMQLRGTKQYWLHCKLVSEAKEAEEKEGFYPLEKKAEFSGKIRFWNMTEDELGLLLWSIQLDPKKSWMNIGKAKPYGYGNISVKLTSVKQLDKRKAYSLECLELDPFTDIDVEKMIQTYKKHINQFLDVCTIDELPSIHAFFKMKDHTMMPDEDRIKYMSVDNGDYQSRKKALPSIEDMTGTID